MINAPIGQLMSQLNMTNVPSTPTAPRPESDFKSTLRSVVEGGGADASSGAAFIRTTTSLTDVQDFINELEPLKDWKHFVFGRTQNGKYEYVSFAIPDRDVTSEGYVPGPYRHHMTGFNFDRIHPSHPDAMNMKYIAARVFEQIDVYSADPVGQAVALLNEAGIPAVQLSEDKIDVGYGPTDVIRNMTKPGQAPVPGRAWHWMPA